MFSLRARSSISAPSPSGSSHANILVTKVLSVSVLRELSAVHSCSVMSCAATPHLDCEGAMSAMHSVKSTRTPTVIIVVMTPTDFDRRRCDWVGFVLFCFGRGDGIMRASSVSVSVCVYSFGKCELCLLRCAFMTSVVRSLCG